MAFLRLIVGLGNPGAEHLRTRHNAGFWFLDALAQGENCRLARDAKVHAETGKLGHGSESILLARPTTFMNRSGQSIAALLSYYKIEPEEMLVAHDDLDLVPGAARLKFDGGHGGQNGLRDIMAHLGHGRFHRLRLGIGHPGDKNQVTNWVLGRAGKADEDAIVDAVTESLNVLPLVLAGNINEAMKRLHTPRTV
jgi:peptidyl-tRNA hydrolase, PTH1 family